jgi:pyrimidine-nucleoside phosphorylase
MRAVDVITRKRDGQALTREEIEFFVEGYTRGDIPDYQAAAWAMAVVWRGMTPEETLYLTQALAESGEQLDLSAIAPNTVDKHSTGGVGDKTTLVVEPLVAACGVPVGKMSGRGLGFSGGTLDKMESIPGFRVDLSREAFVEQLMRVGVVLAGQSADLAPADGKLYSLRDVTGTVPAIPLIASSVMSKKLAAGAASIVLDVKVGRGAFMPTVEDAARLAHLMVEIGKRAGRRVVALLSDMNQPLGHAVGNALEVKEALETLRGGGPADFREHCLVVGGHMLVLGRRADTLAAARKALTAALQDGRGMAKFRELVVAQGGDVRAVDTPERLPRAPLVSVVASPATGYLRTVDALEVGLTAVELGAGRAVKSDTIDLGVGVVVHHKVGDRVEKGEPLFTVHATDPAKRDSAIDRLLAAHAFSRRPVPALPHFYRTLR